MHQSWYNKLYEPVIYILRNLTLCVVGKASYMNQRHLMCVRCLSITIYPTIIVVIALLHLLGHMCVRYL